MVQALGGSRCDGCFAYLAGGPRNAQNAFQQLDQKLRSVKSDSLDIFSHEFRGNAVRIEKSKTLLGDEYITVSERTAGEESYRPVFRFAKNDRWFRIDTYTAEQADRYDFDRWGSLHVHQNQSESDCYYLGIYADLFGLEAKEYRPNLIKHSPY